MLCPVCGTENDFNNFRCTSCSAYLHPPTVPPGAPPPEDTLSTLIPYKNQSALIGYYLAIFSLVPCIGIPLGIAGVVFGGIGLQRANINPAIRGKVHAWVGILLGGFCALGWSALWIAFAAS